MGQCDLPARTRASDRHGWCRAIEPEGVVAAQIGVAERATAASPKKTHLLARKEQFQALPATGKGRDKGCGVPQRAREAPFWSRSPPSDKQSKLSASASRMMVSVRLTVERSLIDAACAR
jgi:hypothetical protein